MPTPEPLQSPTARRAPPSLTADFVRVSADTSRCSKPHAAGRRRRPCGRGTRRLLLLPVLAGWLCGGARAEDWFDQVDRALHWESRDRMFQLDVSGLFDLEGYYIDQRPSGLIHGGGDSFCNPRASLFVDTRLGSHWYSLVQVRADRGFDPRSAQAEVRLDEYLLRYTPFNEAWLNVQAGKFATVYGQWATRHDSWQNPFVTAPFTYENVLALSDHAGPASPAGFLDIQNAAADKTTWIPAIWGPAYSSGVALFGAAGPWDYAVELKNAALSSRPSVWDGTDRGWEDPSVSGRVAFRPNAAWNLGASFSHGAYLLEEATASLPAGAAPGDFKQWTVGPDVSFAWRYWQLWAEAAFTRFDVPRVGDADLVTYFIEARRKLTPHWFVAARWNQQFFGDVNNGAGTDARWDRNTWRAEAAVTWRATRHWQCKLQYGYSHQNGELQQGEQLVAAQVTLRF